MAEGGDRYCLGCGRTLAGMRPQARTCSSACRKRLQRRIERGDYAGTSRVLRQRYAVMWLPPIPPSLRRGVEIDPEPGF
ncbi:MAG TPA: hypothetical protein VFB25_10860 [Gaiellaceae bacterium]|nr:hypothetical protein [Gaiellaceae bacterium]